MSFEFMRKFTARMRSGVCNMNKFLKNFIADESGASAAEYALIIAVVGVGIGAAALLLGANVSSAVADAADDVYDCNNAGTVAPGEVPVACPD
jgi:pilus assembly protein Flp/PilA